MLHRQLVDVALAGQCEFVVMVLFVQQQVLLLRLRLFVESDIEIVVIYLKRMLSLTVS